MRTTMALVFGVFGGGGGGLLGVRVKYSSIFYDEKCALLGVRGSP